MRKQLFAMASSAAIAVATVMTGAGPAGAIQVAPDAGSAAASTFNLVQFGDRGSRGFSGNAGVRSSGRSGNFSARSSGPSRNFTARGISRGDFRGPRASVQRNAPRASVQRNINRGNDARRASREINRRDFARVDRRWDGDRRWDRDRRGHRHGWWRNNHRFLGAVLIGVPFGYAAAASHPCYDWLYGPRGLGYYWNYERCPV